MSTLIGDGLFHHIRLKLNNRSPLCNCTTGDALCRSIKFYRRLITHQSPHISPTSFPIVSSLESIIIICIHTEIGNGIAYSGIASAKISRLIFEIAQFSFLTSPLSSDRRSIRVSSRFFSLASYFFEGTGIN